ncbi:MAG: hypothetical protein HRT44_06590, partial [Bdellovibrionales bacterium]|nr:hypothetical protein [Bdellovibrionales bacterium]NQZ18907.1 hypothetical protein [Bdellovibrionales bacterium]
MMVLRCSKIILAILFSIQIVSCDSQPLNLDFKTSSTLSGKIALNSSSSTQKVVKACASYTVSLYLIDSDGNQAENPVTQTHSDSQGQFVFENISDFGVELDNTNLTDSYLLEASGCNDSFSRVATGVFDQDISVGSTFMSFMLGSESKDSFADILKNQPEDLEEIIGQLQNAGSFNEAFNLIEQDGSLKNKFSQLFNQDTSVLQQTAPRIKSLTVQKLIPENNPTIFAVEFEHWKADYNGAIMWQWDGVAESNSASYSKTPGKNAQGSHNLRLVLGMDNGSGQVDLTKPFRERVFNVGVANTFKPLPPALSLVSSALTNNSNITVQIATGAGQANCETFSNLAILDAGVTPQASDFLYSCSSAGTQNINYSLSNLNNGTRELHLWAIDAAGNVSENSQSVSLVFDNIGPNLQISSPSANARFQSTFTLSGSCEDDRTVNVTGDVSGPASFSCSSGSFSETITLDADEVSKTVNLSLTDGAGNTSTDSIVVVRDNTGPVLTVTSPADSSDHQTQVPIAGNCETGFMVSFTGAGVQGGSQNVMCSGGVYSANVDMSAGEGAKSITIAQSDEAGNPTSIAKSYDRDNSAPTITQTTFTNSTFVSADSVTFGGACEEGSSISVSGADTSSTTCSSSTWTYNTAAQTSDGNYSYTFTHTDEAGNSNAVVGDWKRDRTAPTLNSLSLNSGATSTANNNVLVTFNTSDSRSDIHSFCIKYNDSVAPLAGDPCWTTLVSVGGSVTNNFTLTDYPYVIGTIAGPYDVRVWIKDELDNISANAAVLNNDLFTMNYSPDPPPWVTDVIAAGN